MSIVCYDDECDGCYWCEGKGEPIRPGSVLEGYVLELREYTRRWPNAEKTHVLGSYESAWAHIKKEFEEDGEILTNWQEDIFFSDAEACAAEEMSLSKPTLQWACAQFNPCKLEHDLKSGRVFIWNAYKSSEYCVPYELSITLEKIQ
jgi:hypothetical protein